MLEKYDLRNVGFVSHAIYGTPNCTMSYVSMIKTILIVEDDPFIATDLQDTFEDAGFTVLGPVASVDPGLLILKETRPDIAMLDYNLGRETSIPLAQQLDIKDVPYIFLSGQVERVIASGAHKDNFVISKPFNPEALVSHIESMLVG